MPVLYMYRACDFEGPEDAEDTGGLYEVPLVNDASLSSGFFRDMLLNIEAAVKESDRCIGLGSDMTCVLKHPETGSFVTIAQFIEWTLTNSAISSQIERHATPVKGEA